jgi:GDP-L-fucose synthase
MKILVLGGFGFVGKSVTEELRKKGFDPIQLSRSNGLDLLDLSAAKAKFESIRPDLIINCAAHSGSLHYISEYAADVMHDNTQIILNLYAAVKDACPAARVINPLSNCSYPGNSDIQREDEWWSGPVHKSVWSYGNTRKILKVVSECYAMQYGIKSINFLVPNAYGPGDSTDPNHTHALNGMIIRMHRAKRRGDDVFEIWGSGKPVREWIFVRDIARIFLTVIDRVESQVEPINVAQKKGYSIKEIAEIIKRLMKYAGRLEFNTKYQDGDPKKVLDNTLFRERFPDFRFTDIADGIRETIAYYQKALES